MAWASSIISAVRESWCPQSSVDEGDIDNIGDHTATLCTVNGNLDTNNMSQHSGAMSRQSNAALREAKDSNAQTQVLDIMNQSKAFCPLISFVQCVHPSRRSPSSNGWWAKGLVARSWKSIEHKSNEKTKCSASAPSRVRHVRSATVSRACVHGFNSCARHPRDPHPEPWTVGALPLSRVASKQQSVHHRCRQTVPHFH